MKKWYEWMRDHHDPKDSVTEFIYKNLNEEISCIREWIDAGEYHAYASEEQCFEGKSYAASLDKYYSDQNLSQEQVADWICNPEYDKLIKDSGSQMIIKPPDSLKKQLCDSIRDVFPIAWNVDSHILIQAQRPGDLFPLHYDRYKNHNYHAEQGVVQRWIIMIHDQQPGQCFFMNDCNVSWKAGDVLSWNQTNYSHGSANFGYHTRFSLRITGRVIG